MSAQQQLPLIDLHRHLLGSIPAPLVTEFTESSRNQDLTRALNLRQREFFQSSQHGKQLLAILRGEKPVSGETFSSFHSLPEFLQCYLAASCYVRTGNEFEALVRGVVDDCTQESLQYVEITVSPTLYESRGIPLELQLELLREPQNGHNGAVQWLLDPVRNNGGEAATRLLERCLKASSFPFCGVSLAGDERSHPIQDFAPFFTLAREHNLGTTAHLGEGENVRELIEVLSPPLRDRIPLNRIGHGISAAKSSECQELLKEEGVTLELCVSSNAATGADLGFQEPPARTLFENGLLVTANTDDPFFFRTTLQREIEVITEQICDENSALKKGGIAHDLKKNALNAAFRLPADLSIAG
jgi:adenosine deaminase